MDEPTYYKSCCRRILLGLFGSICSCTKDWAFGSVLWQFSHGKYTSLCGRCSQQAQHASLSRASLFAGMEYGMEQWNGKWNGTMNVYSYS